MTGSLSSWLWWRAARGVGVRPSLPALARVGVPAALLSLAAGTAALGLTAAR